MLFRYFLVLFCIPFIHSYVVIRKTIYGKVKGEVVEGRVSNRKFYQFTGVPYASPPIGKLRFQDPVPPSKWKNVRDALSDPDICIQLDKLGIGPNAIGSEDCLYLKIAFPANANKKLPVMVWIHGGTFVTGNTKITGPDYFMEENVVLVQVQYRLNIFGFLSTQDEYANGNGGLKDQQFALKWIQQNIKYFNGDSDSVTVFGSSAGSASGQFHMLSHGSRGLFHRVIGQSGTPLSRCSLQRNPLKSTNALATGLGIKTSSTRQLIQELQRMPADIILKAAFNHSIMGFFLPYNEQPFGPCIEQKSESSFLSESALKSLEEGDFVNVPYIIGHNTEEGSFPYSYIADGYVDINLYNEDPELIIPVSMNIPSESYCKNTTLNKIKEFYFQNESFTDKSNWINYMGTDIFARGIFKAVDLMCKRMNLYVYIFSSKGHKFTSYDGGAPHYSEVLYLLYPQNPGVWDTYETPEEKITRKRLVRLWTNFATYGNPTPNSEILLDGTIWSKFCDEKLFLDIGTDLLIKRNPYQSEFIFWEDLFNECGFPPFYTY